MTETWDHYSYKYRGKIFSLRTGKARLDNGRLVQRDVIEHLGGVAVVPVVNENSVILLRQFRISIEKGLLELPGGRVEHGEKPKLTARRELIEETGYRAGSLVEIADFWPAPGFTNLRIHVYLAFDLEQIGQRLEWDEKPKLKFLSLSEIEAGLLKHRFKDGNTVIGLFSLIAYLQKPPKNCPPVVLSLSRALRRGRKGKHA